MCMSQGSIIANILCHVLLHVIRERVSYISFLCCILLVDNNIYQSFSFCRSGDDIKPLSYCFSDGTWIIIAFIPLFCSVKDFQSSLNVSRRQNCSCPQTYRLKRCNTRKGHREGKESGKLKHMLFMSSGLVEWFLDDSWEEVKLDTTSVGLVMTLKGFPSCPQPGGMAILRKGVGVL